MPFDNTPRTPPSLGIAEGATTPNPGRPGAKVWSTTLGREVTWNGTNWLSAAPSTVSMTPINFDFGPNLIKSKSFTFSLPSAVPTSKFLFTPAPDSDEYEFDNFIISGYCKVAGTVIVYITAVPGPVRGLRKFNYIVG